MMNSKKPILLVEDDKVDAMTVKRSLREIHVTNDVVVAGNGEEALQFLHQPGAECPCIILLDLNMPKMNGLELLQVLKKDPAFKKVPVVVLTTSKNDQDKFESFDLGVAGYMIKPVDYQQFVDVVRTINLYWTLSEMPDEE